MKFSFNKTILYFMIIPAFLIVLFFSFYPLIYNINLSFREVNANTLLSGEWSFTGLSNYLAVLKDSSFLLILKNTVIFVFACVILQISVGLFLALYFNNDFPYKHLIRGLFLLGWIIPPAVIGTIWRWFLNYDLGVINYFLYLMGLKPVSWLVSNNFSLISVIIANVWFNIPFNMILFTSSLTSIPENIYDAAAVDGTTYFQKTFYITLPLIKSTLYVLIILNTIYTFRSFSLIWNMTKGGPVYSSTILPVWSYIQSFNHYEFGMATAISVLIFFLLLIISIIYIKFFVRPGVEG